MQCFRAAFVALAFLPIGLAHAGWPGDAPDYAGNLQIAQDLISGDTRLTIVGDSLQNQQITANLLNWQPQHLVGVALPSGSRQTTSTYLSFQQPWLAGAQIVRPDELVGDPTFGAAVATATIKATFRDGVVGADTGPLSNRIAAFTFWPFQLNGAPAWMTRNNGQLQLDIQTYNGPHAPASGVIADVWVDGTLVASQVLGVHAATPTYQNHTLTIPTAGVDLSANGLTVRLRMPGGAALSDGQSILLTNARLATGEPGFEIGSISRGGQGLPYFTDRSVISDDAFDAYLTGTAANTSLIWLGQNDKRFTKAEWKAMMVDLIDRFESHDPAMDHILVSTYDTGGGLDEYAAALHEIAGDRDDVLMLNLYAVAGDYAFLDANYLTDGTHQGEAGAAYLADHLWNLIDAAAAEAAVAPEPGSMALIAFGALALLRHRRRGAQPDWRVV